MNEDKENIGASKESLIKYSRYILRKLGHALPTDNWLETFSWPGMQLTAFCRHCKKPFAICGDPGVSKEAQIGRFWKQDWNLVEIVVEPACEVERAWKWDTGPKVSKKTICMLGPRDFNTTNALTNYLFQLVKPGATPLPDDEEGPDPDEVIKRKLSTIKQKYYCQKIRTWL